MSTPKPKHAPDPGPCEVCGRPMPTNGRHPCRFERACSCWYSVPCEPAGARIQPRRSVIIRDPLPAPR